MEPRIPGESGRAIRPTVAHPGPYRASRVIRRFVEQIDQVVLDDPRRTRVDLQLSGEQDLVLPTGWRGRLYRLFGRSGRLIETLCRLDPVEAEQPCVL